MMKLKLMRKTVILMAALFLVCQIVATTAVATTNVTPEGTLTLPVTRKMETNNPVDVTFTYTVTPSESNPAGVEGTIPSFTLAFTSSDTPTNGVISKSTNIDFSQLTFTRAGTYVYTIAETATTNESAHPVCTETYDVYIQVTNVIANNGEYTGVQATISQKKLDLGDGTAEQKQDEVVFPADPVYSGFTVTKTVTGNLGDLEEEFDFTINVNGVPGSRYSVYKNGEKVADYIVGNTYTIKLKHGDVVTVGYEESDGEIPAGTAFTVTEADYTGENYETTVSGEGNTSSAANTYTGEVDDNEVDYVNHRETSSPTGIFLNMAPFVLVIVIAAGAIIMLTKKK